MNYSAIANVLGTLLLVTGGSMVLPIICSLCYLESDIFPLSLSAAGLVSSGILIRLLSRQNNEIDLKEGILIATAGWIIISAGSAIPFVLHGSIPSFTDAFFEMMSGYTTSGPHQFSWQAGDLASGVYFVRAVTDGQPMQTRKVLLLR